MRSAPLAAAVLLSACTAPSPASAPPPSPPSPRATTTLDGARPGDAITLRGRVSSTPWQHLMGRVEGKSDAYLDLAGGREQTVVYWRAPPSCPGDVEVTGTVLEVAGTAKGSKGEGVRELHVDVSAARCAP